MRCFRLIKNIKTSIFINNINNKKNPLYREFSIDKNYTIKISKFKLI